MKKIFAGLLAGCMLVSGMAVFAADETAAEDVMLIMEASAAEAAEDADAEETLTEETVAEEEIAIDTEAMTANAVLIDGEKLEIEDTMGRMVAKDGVVFAPVRVILEALGYQVSWAEKEQMVMGANASNGAMFIMQVDNTFLFYTDGQTDGKLTMEAAPFLNLEEGRTYIPVKAVAEALGYKVGYDTDSNIVTLSK